MKWIESLRNIEKEDILHILESYENLGFLPGIIVPFVETFIPILPLVVIVLANAAAYGLWKGFLFSWIGVCLGSIIIFAISRRYGKNFSLKIQRKSTRAKSFFKWIEKKGFTPIFILSCFPFSPSFIVNIVSGFSGIPIRTYLIAKLSGKAFMIFLVSLIGSDIFTIFQHPWKLVLTFSLFALVWVLARYLERTYGLKDNKV